MLFAAGMSLWYDLGLFAALTVAFPFLWDLLAAYQQERILVGFRPELDPLGKGYQPLLSRDGILHGGWFGKGVFGGEVYEELPASHTDFIFSTVCEKFGFIGGMLVILALGLLVYRILRLSLETRDGLGKLILVGIAAMVVVQSIENIGMCLAKLPVVGITLPFLSYGGSSMLAIYLLFGVLHSVASHGRRRV
jgi:rod shape determining protein RodA